MKNLFDKSTDLKNYVKPSVNIVLFEHAPINVLHVSGDNENVDGISFEDLLSQDNNN